MGRLIYLMNMSLDGFIETPDRSLDWSVVDDELHAWFNQQSRQADAFFYGRRLYEVMSAYWPTSDTDQEATEVMREFGRIWRATPKIVFSNTLDSVEGNSRLLRGDALDHFAALRAEFPGDISVAGPTLASAFVERDLIDEYRLVTHPVFLGAGKPYFPPLADPVQLRLVEDRTFASGVRYQGYARR